MKITQQAFPNNSLCWLDSEQMMATSTILFAPFDIHKDNIAL